MAQSMRKSQRSLTERHAGYLRVWVCWAILFAILDYLSGRAFFQWLDSVWYIGMGMMGAYAVNKGCL